jgi:hypothetical protein
VPIVSERRIHTMWKMVAIRTSDSVITVFPNTFALLVERLLPELDQFERISFKMAASRIAATASSAHKLKMPEWEEMYLPTSATIARTEDRIGFFGDWRRDR